MDDQQPDWHGNGSEFLGVFGVTNAHITRLRVADPSLASASALSAGAALQIAKGLVDNFSLHELELFHSEVDTAGAFALSQALAVNKYLVYLGLSRNPCSANGGDSLAEALKVNQTLKTLDLSWTEAGDETAAAFAECLFMNHSLQRLLLDRNRISCDGSSALATALLKNSKLKHLSLSQNLIRAAGFSFLGQAVARSCALSTLDISMNGVSEPGLFSLFHALAMTGAPSLTTLNVAFNQLSNSVAMVAVFIRRTHALRELNLEGCGIASGPSFKLFTEAIASSKSLCNISLACNNLGDAGVATLATSAVARARKVLLRYVDLSDIGATHHSLASVQALLGAAPSIATFHYSKNNLCGGGAMLADAIASSRLAFVSISDCRLGEEGLDAFAKQLRTHTHWSSLTGLSVRGNDAGDRGIAALLPFVIRLGGMKYLDLGANAATQVTLGRLCDVFEANPDLPWISLDSRTLITRLNQYEPWDALHNKQPGSTMLPLPPLCAAPWDVDPSTFAPSAGFATYSLITGSLMKRHCEGYPAPHPVLCEYAGKPVKHTDVWIGSRRSPSAPDLTCALFNNHITTATSIEFENNLGGLLTSDDQLRREFNRLDVKGRGYLDADELSVIFLGLQHFGVCYTKADIDSVIAATGDGKRIDFDQFCVLYLRLVRA